MASGYQSGLYRTTESGYWSPRVQKYFANKASQYLRRYRGQEIAVLFKPTSGAILTNALIHKCLQLKNMCLTPMSYPIQGVYSRDDLEFYNQIIIIDDYISEGKAVRNIISRIPQCVLNRIPITDIIVLDAQHKNAEDLLDIITDADSSLYELLKHTRMCLLDHVSSKDLLYV